MNKIFRLRPANEITIEELKNHYLWFSRPTEYSDIEDSNVLSFINNNESIEQSFKRMFNEYERIADLSKLIGICCFTKKLPKSHLWRKFPKGHNAIVIEYNKEIIVEHLIDEIGLGDCFRNVEYLPNPTLFKSYSKYDIIWNQDTNGESYKTLNEIEKDPKLLDELFLKMFTRINEKFSSQNEARIILGGENIPNNDKKIKGYKINIPDKSVLKIYTNSKTPKKFIKTLNELGIKTIEIN